MIQRHSTKKVAFCSNVENLQAVEDEIYKAVTTSQAMSTSLKLTWKESVANEKSKYVEIKWKANDKKISRARKKNEQILTYQQFSRPNQKYHADGQKATIRIDKPELNLFDFVDSLNNILRDCILVDSQTAFEFRESYTALLLGIYIKPKVECKLEEIDGEFI